VLTNFTTTTNFILIIPHIIFNSYVRPDLIQSYGTVSYILLRVIYIFINIYIQHKDGFLESGIILLIII